MRKFLFAVAFLFGGAIALGAATPAQALPTNTISELGRTLPETNVSKAYYYYYYPRRRYYYYYYPRRYYYRRYYYHRPCWRRYYRHRCYW